MNKEEGRICGREDLPLKAAASKFLCCVPGGLFVRCSCGVDFWQGGNQGVNFLWGNHPCASKTHVFFYNIPDEDRLDNLKSQYCEMYLMSFR